MTGRPATPTLFPYTTLFRSAARQNFALGAAHPPGVQHAVAAGREQPFAGVIEVKALDRTADAEAEREADRKSTRLNSSHPSNSYAVFCLKKKRRRQPVLRRD